MPRSISLRLLSLACVALGAFNLLGGYTLVQDYSYLRQLPFDLPLPYLVASRVCWGVIWLMVALGVWRRSAWARAGMLAGSVLYVAQGWFDRLVWGRSDYLVVTRPWAAVASVLGVALAWWIVLRYRHWGEAGRKPPRSD
jgi:hypothetical protein